MDWYCTLLVTSSLSRFDSSQVPRRCRRALVQLSYAIGVAEPLSIFVDTYGTGKRSDLELVEIIRKNWDLRPGVIVKQLDLQKPIYRRTAAYGHFGNPDYTWEKPKQLVL